jgi:hypothetical protein
LGNQIVALSQLDIYIGKGIFAIVAQFDQPVIQGHRQKSDCGNYDQ